MLLMVKLNELKKFIGINVKKLEKLSIRPKIGVITMLLKYKGDGYRESFIPNHVYEARKSRDVFGEYYAIFDEGEDWYRYGADYVKENFVEVAEDVENIRKAV